MKFSVAMAEFSVIIKKKDSDVNRKVMFLDSTDYSSDDTAQLSTPKKTKKKKKSPRKRLLEKRQQTFPVCPVCRDLLDERIKRIYTKPISTEVYFPFLDHVPSIPSSRSTRVKICYPCYEHLMRQWKEFNRAGIPQRKRKYRDRNGKISCHNFFFTLSFSFVDVNVKLTSSKKISWLHMKEIEKLSTYVLIFLKNLDRFLRFLTYKG